MLAFIASGGRGYLPHELWYPALPYVLLGCSPFFY